MLSPRTEFTIRVHAEDFASASQGVAVCTSLEQDCKASLGSIQAISPTVVPSEDSHGEIQNSLGKLFM